jgi:Lon protease-like protein
MQLPSDVPVMTLPNATLFPGALLPLYIFEPRYRQMLDQALNTHRMLAVAMKKPGRTRETPCTMAGLGLIRVAVTQKDGTSYLILQGLVRARLDRVVSYRPFRVHRYRPLLDTPADGPGIKTLTRRVQALARKRLNQGIAKTETPPLPEISLQEQNGLESLAAFSLEHFLKYLTQLKDPGQVADLVSCTMLSEAADRQTVLETVDPEARLRHVIRFLLAEIRRSKSGPSKSGS